MKQLRASILLALAFVAISALFNSASAQRVGVSTNALELVMLVPNVTAELTLGGQSSMAVSLSLNSGVSISDNFYLELMRVGYEYRKWFRHAMSGHYCGINASYSDVKFAAIGKNLDFEQFSVGFHQRIIFFDEAMDYMLQCKKEGKSFFTYLATNTCHAPELVPEKYAEKYRKVKQHNGVAVPDMFYGMIANLDENMGRLELFLTENNLKDNTIVVFSSDNGTQNTNAYKIFNAGMQGKKQSAFDGGHRVPLFITYMNGTLMSGVCRDDLTQAQDILPTLLDLAGIEDQPQCDGVSLKPLFKTMNNRLEDRMCVVQYKMGSKWDAKNCVVMWDNWRLLSRGRLYDISRDPHQDKNIASKHPEVVKAMSDYYDQWYDEVKPLFDRKRYITIGADAANPTMLYANDWNGDACDNSAALFQANGTGYFDIDIAKSGNYKITISRWPDDANLPLNGYDDKFIVYTNNTQGKCNNPSDAAKPIAKAEIKVGEYSKKVKVKAKDTSVSFNVELESGKSTLEGLFYNSEGDVICGALYIEVERK